MKKTLIKALLIVALLCIPAVLSSCSDECRHEHMTQTVVEPTHDKQGRTVNYCNDCEYEYSSDFVPPAGHLLAKEVHEPTCTEVGYTYNHCSCGYHYNSAYLPPTGHALSITDVEPTCDGEGYKIADCSICGEHYTYEITSPIGHSLKIERDPYVSANTPISTAHYTCDRCGLDYMGDCLFYHDIYKGAYVENTKVLSKGVDVSYHQHDAAKDADNNTYYIPLDWKKIKEQGYDFAILRIGYMGSGNKFVLDPVFEMNYTDAKAAGLDVGAYFYSYAYSIEDAQAEAQAALDAIKGKQFEYPIFFDMEDSLIVSGQPSAAVRTDICFEFISILQENGYYGALYSSNYWLTNYLIKNELTSMFDIWYARYLYNADSGVVVNELEWDAQKYGTQMAMWQFSETGNIDGIVRNFEKDKDGNPVPVRFDLNYSYKDYPTLIKSLGLNGFPPQKDLSSLDGSGA